jgi:ketosteroid isomerase-like protein
MGKFVVRGGKGCSTRKAVAGGDKSPTRVAVCCSRAVGIDSGNKNASFRISAAKKILDYEAALRNNNHARIAGMYADDVSFLGKRFDKTGLMREYARDMKRFPKQWSFFDTCKVEVGKDAEGEAALVSDCQVTFRRGKNAYGANVRFVHGGSDSKIIQVGFKAAKGESVPSSDSDPGGGEEKEGFGFLIPADD